MPYKNKEDRNKNARQRYSERKNDIEYMERMRVRGRKNSRKSYQLNREKKLEGHRKWYLKNKDKIEYKEKIKKASRKSYLKNKEKVLVRGREREQTGKRKEDHKNWALKNQEKVKAIRKKQYIKHYPKYTLKHTYGITVEQFKSLLILQNNKCGICEKEFKKIPCIDHNHKTGKIRGVLCSSCNSGLGSLGDSPEIINRAINWLQGKMTFRKRATELSCVRDKAFGRYIKYKYKYKIILDQFNNMLLNQDNKCGICEMPFENKNYFRPAIDHEHSTGIIRGLLCSKCNLGIGHLKENPKNLNKAIDWLKRSYDANS